MTFPFPPSSDLVRFTLDTQGRISLFCELCGQPIASKRPITHLNNAIATWRDHQEEQRSLWVFNGQPKSEKESL